MLPNQPGRSRALHLDHWLAPRKQHAEPLHVRLVYNVWIDYCWNKSVQLSFCLAVLILSDWSNNWFIILFLKYFQIYFKFLSYYVHYTLREAKTATKQIIKIHNLIFEKKKIKKWGKPIFVLSKYFFCLLYIYFYIYGSLHIYQYNKQRRLDI